VENPNKFVEDLFMGLLGSFFFGFFLEKIIAFYFA
jgi:hypothetical protein